MHVSDDYPIQILEREFSRRKQRNSSYSLRAFAKDLKMDSSNLSAILRRKRSIPLRRVQSIVNKMDLRPTEKQLFIQSTQRRKFNLANFNQSSVTKKVLTQELHYSLLAEWEYYAVLKLLELDMPPQTELDVAKRLGISSVRSANVIKNLMELGFISRDQESNALQRCVSQLDTSDDVDSSALKKGNLEALDLAKKAVSLPVSERDFGIITMAFDPDRIDEFKGIIRDFQDKMLQFAEQGEKKEVYQFTTQLIPISIREKKNL